MRFARLTTIAALAISADVLGAQVQQSAAKIRRVVVSIAATNDEWTTTGLSVNKNDLLIIAANGTIRVGAMTGEVDATGTRPGGSSSTGYGVLEFKIGVSAGQPAGTFALHSAESRGELKLRVKDSRYDDNSGAFEVDVVVIPQAALPEPVRVGDPPEEEDVSGAANEVARALITAMKLDLRNMVSAQESYFADNGAYATRLADIGFRLSEGVVLKSLNAGAGAWTAVVTHARISGVECAIAVNAKNPLVTTAGEGEPACR